MTLHRGQPLTSHCSTHSTIGRDRIASRIAELNAALLRGLAPGQVVARLAEKKIRTTTSPYKVSYARVSAGIMNRPEEIELVLREIRALS